MKHAPGLGALGKRNSAGSAFASAANSSMKDLLASLFSMRPGCANGPSERKLRSLVRQGAAGRFSPIDAGGVVYNYKVYP